jgi:hypothetical protein
MDLYNACKEGNLYTVQSIFKKGDHESDYGLKCACKGGHLLIVQFMIDQETEMTPDYNQGMRGACEGGHPLIVKLMIQKGIENGIELDYYWGNY